MQHQGLVRELGIQAIVRLDEGFGVTHLHWQPEFNVLHRPIEDGMPIPAHIFNTVTSFMDEHLTQGNKVLIHCQAGVSRSVTLAMAYLIACSNLDLAEAFRRIHDVRPSANPHPALVWSLVEHYKLPYTRAKVNEYDFLERLIKYRKP